jgi:hypothetical protein
VEDLKKNMPNLTSDVFVYFRIPRRLSIDVDLVLVVQMLYSVRVVAAVIPTIDMYMLPPHSRSKYVDWWLSV